MHLGNIATALISWISARSQSGEWIVRIEDLDRSRSRDYWAKQLLDDLDWLGLVWDDEPLCQSERDDIYESFFSKLDTYPCYCSRADLLAASAPHASDGHHVYSGACRPADGHDSLSAIKGKEMGKSPAWRVKIGNQRIEFDDKVHGHQCIDMAREWGDFVVRRANGEFAYQLAVVVDDALSGVTEVVRGDDLLSSSAPQIFLYNEFGLEEPQYAHIPLMCNAQGQRLSKRDQSLSLENLRTMRTPADIIGWIACAYGLQPTPDPISARSLAQHFSDSSFAKMRDIEIKLP